MQSEELEPSFRPSGLQILVQLWPRSPEEEIKRVKIAQNYYEVLNISQDAPNHEVNRHFVVLKDLLRGYHYDLETAQDAIVSVTWAHSTLNSALKRSFYDEFLRRRAEDFTAQAQVYQQWEYQKCLKKWPKPPMQSKAYYSLLIVFLLPSALIFCTLFVAIERIFFVIKGIYGFLLWFFFPGKYAQMKAEEEQENVRWRTQRHKDEWKSRIMQMLEGIYEENYEKFVSMEEGVIV